MLLCYAGTSLGPFQLLQDCWNSRSPVRVWTRHCVGVRGVCEGVPLAFDKHMNLVLGDATEYFQPFRTVGNGGLDSSKKKKKKRKAKEISESNTTESVGHVTRGCSHMLLNLDSFQTRQLSKVFVRGDNVVIISPKR